MSSVDFHYRTQKDLKKLNFLEMIELVFES